MPTRPNYTPDELRRTDEYIDEVVAAAPTPPPELVARLRRILADPADRATTRRGEPAA